MSTTADTPDPQANAKTDGSAMPGAPQNPPAQDQSTEAAAAPEASADAETPEWQRPDYAGALDVTQANWRNHNIKPVDAPERTKAKTDKKPR